MPAFISEGNTPNDVLTNLLWDPNPLGVYETREFINDFGEIRAHIANGVSASHTPEQFENNMNAVKEIHKDDSPIPLDKLTSQEMYALGQVYDKVNLCAGEFMSEGSTEITYSMFNDILSAILTDVDETLSGPEAKLPDDYLEQLRERINNGELCDFSNDPEHKNTFYVLDCIENNHTLIDGYNKEEYDIDIEKMTSLWGVEIDFPAFQDVDREGLHDILEVYPNEEDVFLENADPGIQDVHESDNDISVPEREEDHSETIDPAPPDNGNEDKKSEINKGSAVIEKISKVLEFGIETGAFLKEDLHNFNSDKRIESDIKRSDGKQSSFSVAYLQSVVDGKEPISDLCQNTDWDKVSMGMVIPVLDTAIENLKSMVDEGILDKNSLVSFESVPDAPASLVEFSAGKTVEQAIDSFTQMKETCIALFNGVDPATNDTTLEEKGETEQKSPGQIYREAMDEYNDRMARFGPRDISTAVSRLNMDIAGRKAGEKIGAGRIVCDFFGILQSNLIETAVIHLISLVCEKIEDFKVERDNLIAPLVENIQLKSAIQEYRVTTDADQKEQIIEAIMSVKGNIALEAIVDSIQENQVDIQDEKAMEPYIELLGHSHADAETIENYKGRMESLVTSYQNNGDIELAKEAQNRIDIISTIEDVTEKIEIEPADNVDNQSTDNLVNPEALKPSIENEDAAVSSDIEDAEKMESDSILDTEKKDLSEKNIEDGQPDDVSAKEAATGDIETENEIEEDEKIEETSATKEAENELSDFKGEGANTEAEEEGLKDKIADYILDATGRGVEEEDIVKTVINDMITPAMEQGESIADIAETFSDVKEMLGIDCSDSNDIVSKCEEAFEDKITDEMNDIDSVPSEFDLATGKDEGTEGNVSVEEVMKMLDDLADKWDISQEMETDITQEEPQEGQIEINTDEIINIEDSVVVTDDFEISVDDMSANVSGDAAEAFL